MATCKIEADIRIAGVVVKSKSWPACDIMKTGSTRGWASRQFNIFLKSAPKDNIVRAEWTARYGEEQGHQSISGWISGVNGRTMVRRGIFED